MRIIILIFSVIAVQSSFAETAAENWFNLTKSEKYHYVVGYIDGQLAMNDTIPDIHAQGVGTVNIPNITQLSATIENMSTLYENSKLKNTYWHLLMPLAITKAKNPAYNLDPWIKGLELKLITSKGSG